MNPEILAKIALAPIDKVLGVNWKEIQKIPVFTVNDAVKLSLDFKLVYTGTNWVMPFTIYDDVDHNVLKSDLSFNKHTKILNELLDTLVSRATEANGNIAPYGELPIVEKANQPGYDKVRLVDFAAWAKERGWSLPENFPCEDCNDAVNPTQGLSNLTKPGSSYAVMEEKKELAMLFDPVTVASLEKAFPTDGKWKKWSNKAKENGLIKAREGRRMFNPYKAGIWFLDKGVANWDIERVNRTLANKLPERSKDYRHLLIPGSD